MTIGGGEAADQMVRMMLSGGEVAVRLGGSALKNLLALTMALARHEKALSGKVNMNKMLRETRDLRLFPMSPEQFKQFQKHAKRQKILFSAIKDRDGRGRVIDVVMPVTELDRANLIFERILYQGPTRQTPEREERAPSGPVRGPVEPSQERGREPHQQGREGPQKGRLGPEQAAPGTESQQPQDPTAHSRLPDDPWEIPPKKDSRSGRDSPAINTSSATPSDSERMRRMVEGPIDRPSVEERLKGFQAQLEQKRKLAPTRNRKRNMTKAR